MSDENDVNRTISAAAAIMGRLGGQSKSELKKQTCRRNIAHYNAIRTKTAMTPAERKARRKAQRLARRITRAHR